MDETLTAEPTRHIRKREQVKALQLDGTKEAAQLVLEWVEVNGGTAMHTYYTRGKHGLKVGDYADNFHLAPGEYITLTESGRFARFSEAEFVLGHETTPSVTSEPTGWTPHGHRIPGMAQSEIRPKTTARCGGPRICNDCSKYV